MSGANTENKGYLGALPKQNQFNKPVEDLEEPKSPTSKFENGAKYFVDASTKLEKEERAAILAQWKREHDDRERFAHWNQPKV